MVHRDKSDNLGIIPNCDNYKSVHCKAFQTLWKIEKKLNPNPNIYTFSTELVHNYSPGHSILPESLTELSNPNDSIRDFMSFEDNLALAALENHDVSYNLGSKEGVLYELGMHKTRIPAYKN